MPPSDDRLRASLFKDTSAFDRAALANQEAIAEIQRQYPTITPSPAEHLGKIASLIEEAIDAPTDTDLLPLLEEALELARKHV